MVSVKRQIANIYVVIRTFFLMLFYRGKNNKSVLIIADGLIGDTILIQDFLKECYRYFIVKKGYTVDLFISKSVVASFVRDCCDTNGINVLDFHFKKKNTELPDLLSVLKRFRNKEYELLLNPHPKHKGDKLAACLKAKRKMAVRSDLHIKGLPLNNLFRKLAYTDTLEVPLEEMEFERYKKLLHMAGDYSYRTSIPTLKETRCEILVSGRYCVFACGASECGKKWELEKYIEIANYVRNNMKLPIIFVGGREDEKDAVYILNKMSDSSGCMSLAGKTSFAQWVDVIRKAQFVIGNDSASVHIAASTGTKSICVVGKWQYKRFYPYILDHEVSFSPVPVFCTQALPCENCGKVLEIMPNKKCRQTITSLESYVCIKKIETRDVINVLSQF